MKPMNIIFLGAIIIVVGGIIGAIGTLLHNKKSSEKSDKILSTSKNNQELIENLKRQNDTLRDQANYSLNKLISQGEVIDKLRSENIELSSKLLQSNKHIFNNLTGGEGYAEFRILKENSPKNLALFISNMSNFPIYDLNIQITDYEKSKIRDKRAGHFIPGNIVTSFQIPFMNASTSLEPKTYILEPEQNNIFLEIRVNARNGSFVEFFNIIGVKNTQWEQAIVIYKTKNDGSKPDIILNEITPNFPKDEKGEPKWTY